MKPHRISQVMAVVLLATDMSAYAADLTQLIAAQDLVFEEVDGVAAVEAEHFYKQTLTEKRAWHITSSQSVPDVKPDSDPAHVAGASGGAYVEILPDTRSTDKDKLISGENFSNEPGKMAVLHYKTHFNHPGRYYVWVRAYSTGAEDNGVHVGLDGQWPESGQRWQTVQKQKWAWDSKQRTEQNHSGEPAKLFLDIDQAGEHEIQFSLREDGFEMDKFILARSQEFMPEGPGPAPKVKSGKAPAPFPEVKEAPPAAKAYPKHWGEPPKIQTRDLRELPGGYGMGSSTLAKWIQDRLEQDAAADSFPTSRDPLQWPFAQNSIWNMPIGSEAVYVPANIPPQKQVQPEEDILILESDAPRINVVYNGTTWRGPSRYPGKVDTNRVIVRDARIPDGFVVLDKNMNYACAILMDDGVTIKQNQPFSRFPNASFATSAYVVDNNGPTSIGGGGKQRQPLAPPFRAGSTNR